MARLDFWKGNFYNIANYYYAIEVYYDIWYYACIFRIFRSENAIKDDTFKNMLYLN